MKSLCIRVKGGFLLILFLFFFGSTTFFNHVHTIDGVAVVHSHPFRHAGGGTPLHGHTSTGFLLIQFLSAFTAIASILFILPELSLRFNPVFFSAHVSSLKHQSFHYPCLFRGPPSLMII